MVLGGYGPLSFCQPQVQHLTLIENEFLIRLWISISKLTMNAEQRFSVRLFSGMLVNPLRPSIKLQILLLCFHIFLTEVVGEKLLKYQ